MNGEIAIVNDFRKALQPRLRAVNQLQRATRRKTAIEYRENDGVEYRLVSGIERTIYEDAESRVRVCGHAATG